MIKCQTIKIQKPSPITKLKLNSEKKISDPKKILKNFLGIITKIYLSKRKN